jgi:3-oxoacyl-[acyl-carrier-protein] synthase-3
MLLTVVGAGIREQRVGNGQEIEAENAIAPYPSPIATIAPHLSPIAETASAYLLRQLALVWLEFERKLRSLPLLRRLHRGEFTLEDYKALLRNLRPQVVEGARWIARAASNMSDFQLRSTLIGHAQDEHRDFQMLERNYVSVGGELQEIVEAEKNLGSEALSAFIFHQASRENPVDLIGSIFIIEGLGNNLAAQWAVQIKQTLNLKDEQVSFLAYHGANDAAHIGKLNAILNAEWMTMAIAQRIVKTAQVTARLYLMQLEEIR